MSPHPLLKAAWHAPPHLQLILLVATSLVLLSILSTALLIALATVRFILRSHNPPKRAKVLASLGIDESAKEEQGKDRRTVVGFFHPYCNAGGGGERVLWTAIACIQHDNPDGRLVSVVFTGDDVPKADMIAKVQARFGITLDATTLAFVHLSKRHLVEDSAWPRFTLIGQSLGSIVLAFEALSVGLVPDVWLVGSYTHYPTISTDMLHRVKSRQSGHTNKSTVAKSLVLTYLKLLYYLIFAELYSLCLRQADVLMVNSTWTRRHINRLLQEREGEGGRFKVARTVYPPCDTLALAKLPLEQRERIVLSLAQFRPEKDHQVQLHAFSTFLLSNPLSPYRLILAGSVRNASDSARVDSLRSLALELGLVVANSPGEEGANVEFVINVPYPELIELLGRAEVGLHTMVDEHFGITVVEFMNCDLEKVEGRSERQERAPPPAACWLPTITSTPPRLSSSTRVLLTSYTMSSIEKQFPMLPTETWIEILTEHGLSYHDLKRVAGVSHAFKTMIESSPLDALLFRGEPQATLPDGTTILLHPVLLNGSSFLKNSVGDFKLISSTLTKTWKIRDLACANDFATSPPVSILFVRDGEEEHEYYDEGGYESTRSTGVRVIDVLERIAERWNGPPEPQLVGEINRNHYRRYLESADATSAWEEITVDTDLDLFLDHGPDERYWNGWKPVELTALSHFNRSVTYVGELAHLHRTSNWKLNS
ncbi:hypothetical protein RQP46_006596 [Phenoliferia psychrophenolica]